MARKAGTNEISQESIPLSGWGSRDPELEENEGRGHWGSQTEYLLSMIGYSVGLSNVWRFPYICNRNGGGAFLIPFMLCVVLCGLPLFLLEMAIGQFSGKGALHVWSLCPLMKGIGYGMLIISMLDPIYYTMLCAWSFFFAIFSCKADLPWTSCDNTWNTDNCVTNIKTLRQGMNSTIANSLTSVSSMPSNKINTSYIHSDWENQTLSHTAAEEFWQYRILGISTGLGDFGAVRWELVLCLLGSWVIICLCVIKGIKSVGKAVYVTATLPYVILIILLVRGLTLPGGPSGALYFIKPDFSKLLNIQVWLEAFIQVLYSLGPAQGGIISMASYNKFHTNCLRDAMICTFVSESTSLFAGLVVFTILGFMAQEANVPITDVVSSGPGLGFVSYPEVLAQFPIPQLWSFIFFIMLMLLALDSLFGMVETALSVILDEFSFLRRWRVPLVVFYCAISFLIGLLFTTQGGMYVFQLVEWYLGSLFFSLACFLECVVLGWVYGVQRFAADIEMMTGKRASVFFQLAWCYITPALLMVTFIVTLSQYQTPTYGKYVYPENATVFGWFLACLPVAPILVMMGLAIYRGKGPLLQRLKQSVVPDKSWGPSTASYRQQYREENSTKLSFKETCIASVSCNSR